MKTALLAVALAFAACSVSEFDPPDASAEDAVQAQDACACTGQWRCEWPESGVVVFSGDCIYCEQGDNGKYVCMNLPAVP